MKEDPNREFVLRLVKIQECVFRIKRLEQLKAQFIERIQRYKN